MDTIKSLKDQETEELLHHSGQNTSRSGFRWSTISGGRLLFATCACLAAASLFGLLSVMIWTNQSKFRILSDQEREIPRLVETRPKLDEWSPLNALKGAATDSLWGGSKYRYYI